MFGSIFLKERWDLDISEFDFATDTFREFLNDLKDGNFKPNIKSAPPRLVNENIKHNLI